ncbi:MAG: NADH-quinone oxidoreductase subunit G, partial [Rhizobiales bacterium]|nr:NADH-quinone oxidoreductase subunit G [Hyphomicrobiales bacterium]
NKRAVEDKYIGPLVKTWMNRCIHCTRCIRFSTEVAGVSELGATGRGEDMEITTYLEEAMTSELQGNVVDLCPVGALTSRPYSFKARPWELSKTESIDVMDALGSNIRVDARGKEVMRILPRLNDFVNEEWISDKTRHVVDGLRTQRLDRPYLRVDGRLRPVSWAEAFASVAERVSRTSGERMGAIAGDLASVEEMFALKLLMEGLGSRNIDCRQDGVALDPSLGRGSYLFNATVAGIESADAVLLIGSNPRIESPVLNARIRKRWRLGGLPIALIGEPAELTYSYDHLGGGPESLSRLLSGEGDFYQALKAAKRPLIIVGQGALMGRSGAAVLSAAAKLAVDLGTVSEDWIGLSVLHTAASRIGGLDLGFVPGDGEQTARDMVVGAAASRLDVLVLLGADEIAMPRPGAFVVYLGTHGDAGAHRADVILPGAAYTEKSGIWVNTEGRVQLGLRAAFPPGEARDDWSILRALSGALGSALPFNSLQELRARLYAAHPHMARFDEVKPGRPADVTRLAGLGGELAGSAFPTPIKDFYLTNPIARASRIMAECSALRLGPVAQAAE